MLNTPAAERIRLALTIVAWLGLIVCVLSIASNQYAQWDFRVFYTAAHALVSGDNPYHPSHGQTGLPYLYPPLALYLFRWTTLLSLRSAMLVWLGLKLVALALLARLWHKDFERLDVGWPIVLFIALGFNAALLRDFTTGNVSTFEELGVWFGFSLLLRDRPYSAALILACVAQLKLLPAAFIGLIPLVKPQGGWKPFVAGFTVFLGLFALNLAVSPELTHDYLDSFSHSNPNLDERGIINPSSLAFIRDVIDLSSNLLGLPINRNAGTIAYMAYLLALVLVLFRIARCERVKIRSADPRLLLYFGCALFAVAMPRMKDYSYILMLIPTLFVVRNIGKGRIVPDYLLLAVGLMICAQSQQTYVPGLMAFVSMLQAYLPLFLAAAVMVYMRALLL